jgi:hypothetical protein
MARLATLWVAALSGALIAGCSGGSFGTAGLSLPAASDGVQTVSDAADALVAHRQSATDNAKAAISVTDALGSFAREIGADQRVLAGSHRVVRQDTLQRGGKQISSGSELVLRPRGGSSNYCESSAGYLVSGIPSLDRTFGWESGAFSGGTRTSGSRGLSRWSANATGAVVQGSIGTLSIARGAAAGGCPMNAPAFILNGGDSENAFSIPISMAFHHGELANLSVAGAKFANGETLGVTTASDRQPVEINGVIANGRTQVATFRTDADGNGTLTITSTGAQYIISDWIVIGT